MQKDLISVVLAITEYLLQKETNCTIQINNRILLCAKIDKFVSKYIVPVKGNSLHVQSKLTFDEIIYHQENNIKDFNTSIYYYFCYIFNNILQTVKKSVRLLNPPKMILNLVGEELCYHIHVTCQENIPVNTRTVCPNSNLAPQWQQLKEKMQVSD